MIFLKKLFSINQLVHTTLHTLNWLLHNVCIHIHYPNPTFQACYVVLDVSIFSWHALVYDIKLKWRILLLVALLTTCFHLPQILLVWLIVPLKQLHWLQPSSQVAVSPETRVFSSTLQVSKLGHNIFLMVFIAPPSIHAQKLQPLEQRNLSPVTNFLPRSSTHWSPKTFHCRQYFTLQMFMKEYFFPELFANFTLNFWS